MNFSGMTVRSLVTADGLDVLEQFHTVDSGIRSLEINQVWRSLDRAKASGDCSYSFAPDGFQLVALRARRTNIANSVTMQSSGGYISVERNGDERARIPAPAGEILFDVDDPFVDWINCIMIVGLCRGETLDRPVHYLDIASGSIACATYRFEWRESEIVIIKSPDPRRDCRLVLQEDGFRLQRAASRGFNYEYDYSG
jgi:hypothetical protein